VSFCQEYYDLDSKATFLAWTVLIAVVGGWDYRAGAEALGVSPSGVSGHSRAWNTRRCAATGTNHSGSLSRPMKGRRFYEQVGRNLAGIEEAAIAASGSANKYSGRLRVNIDPTSLASSRQHISQRSDALQMCRWS